MYVLIISQFLQFVVAPTGCIINAMDLKIFPNTSMLLKVCKFEGFFKWSNVDELVINNTSRYVTVTITNLINTITNLIIT